MSALPRLHTLWHWWLGHINDKFQELLRHRSVIGLGSPTPSKSLCQGHVYGSQQKDPFPKHKTTRAFRLLELIHSESPKCLRQPRLEARTTSWLSSMVSRGFVQSIFSVIKVTRSLSSKTSRQLQNSHRTSPALPLRQWRRVKESRISSLFPSWRNPSRVHHCRLFTTEHSWAPKSHYPQYGA